MDCNCARALIELYLDDELDREQAAALEAHVDGCADCRGALNGLGEVRRALRDESLRRPAPQALRDRIGADVQAQRPVRNSRARRSAPWMRYAAACLLAFGAGGISLQAWNRLHGTTERTQLARDLFASHWRALAANSPVDVVSSDRHTVKPWFAGRIAQSPPVRDLVEQGFPLVGGRLDYVGDSRVAVLVYRHGHHLIDVYMLPSPTTGPVATTAQQGYTLEPITLDGQRAAIVTDMDLQELARFERLLRQ